MKISIIAIYLRAGLSVIFFIFIISHESASQSKSDCTVENVSVSPTSDPSPSTVDVSFRVYNHGIISTYCQGGFNIIIYWLTNTTISGSDTKLHCIWEISYTNAGNFKELQHMMFLFLLIRVMGYTTMVFMHIRMIIFLKVIKTKVQVILALVWRLSHLSLIIVEV